MKKISFIFFSLITLSCNHHSLSKEKKDELWNLIKSDNVHNIIYATIEIQKAKDTSMINALLYKSDDQRISNEISYKGMSLYQIKMNALRIITNINPPKEITYEVDTSIIKFYKNTLNKK